MYDDDPPQRPQYGPMTTKQMTAAIYICGVILIAIANFGAGMGYGAIGITGVLTIVGAIWYFAATN